MPEARVACHEFLVLLQQVHLPGRGTEAIGRKSLDEGGEGERRMRRGFLLLRLLRVRSWRCLGALIAGYEGCFDNEELEAGKMRVFGCDVVGGGVHDR